MNMCIVCVSACGERENASISVISVHIMGRGKKLRVRLDLKGQVSWNGLGSGLVHLLKADQKQNFRLLRTAEIFA